MYVQQQYNPQQPVGKQMGMPMNLSEKDLFHSILTTLKQSIGEYATAAMEASCPVVRQNMVRLLNETLTEQADCFSVMSRQGWYGQMPTTSRQDVHSEIMKHRQGAQEISQMVQSVGMRPMTQQMGTNYYGGAQQGWQSTGNQMQGPTGSWQQGVQQSNQSMQSMGQYQPWQNQAMDTTSWKQPAHNQPGDLMH